MEGSLISLRMAWWVLIALVSIQTILIQYMLEIYQAGHSDLLPYYILMMILVFVVSWISYLYFRKVEETQE